MKVYELRLRRVVGGRVDISVIDMEEGRVIAHGTVERRADGDLLTPLDLGELPLDVELSEPGP